MGTVVSLAAFRAEATKSAEGHGSGNSFQPLGHEDVCYSAGPWRGHPEERLPSTFGEATTPLKGQATPVADIVADRPEPTEWR